MVWPNGRLFGNHHQRIERNNRTRIPRILISLFDAPRFLKSLARDPVDVVIDAEEFRDFSRVGHVYLRSAMWAPNFSSIVLPDLRVLPSIPSPPAWVAANFSNRDTLFA
jgi:hypothetical protein